MYLIILFISAVRTVSRGHHLVAEGWALFEKTCSDVGAGELPQLLRYVKQATTPTPTGTPTPTKLEEEMDVDVEASTSEAQLLHEKPIHVTEVGKTLYYRCPNCDITPKKSKWVWIPISVLSTQRRLSCAPSVPSALTTWIRSRGMRRSTSRAFFGVDLG